MTDPVAARWWESFFQGPAVEIWRRATPRDVSKGQAMDLWRALALTGTERVLDVPCGNGRLALELAAQGCRVTGLDQDPEALSRGRTQAAERDLDVTLTQGDMRHLPWKSAFDAAFCAGNSFGYLDHDGNVAFLRAIAAALVPGGRFLLEYPLVAELTLARGDYRDWLAVDELLMLSEGGYEPRTKRLEVTYTFLDLSQAGGAAEHRTASYAVYPASAITEFLRASGFGEIELLADPEGSPFENRGPTFYARAVRSS